MLLSITDQDKADLKKEIADQPLHDVSSTSRRLHQMADQGHVLTGFSKADMKWLVSCLQDELIKRSGGKNKKSDYKPLEFSTEHDTVMELASKIEMWFPPTIKKIKERSTKADVEDGDNPGDDPNDPMKKMPIMTAADGTKMFRISPIKLDAHGDLPSVIMLMETGTWPDSVKGNFEITPQDLQQIKDNFDSGVGFPSEDASTGLAIDFKHEYADEAAAWIKGLELRNDPTTGKTRLFANPVEWTDAGEQAVRGGRFKLVSPSGFFGRKNGKVSMWANPQNLKEKIPNVLDGAGLTNIPFLRGMEPIRADRLDEDVTAYDKVMFVYDEQKNKEPRMNLDALRVKEREELSVPELDFIAEHKDELSAPEVAKFKLDAAGSGEDSNISEEDKQTLDAIKSGSKKLVDSTQQTAEKERLDRMESTIERYRKQEVETLLDSHVKRGALKQDQAKLDGFWGKQLLTAETEEQQQAVKDALEALPSNEQFAKEIGTGEDVAAGSTAREQLDKLAWAKVREAEKNGKELLYRDALKQVYKENEDLKTQDKQELTKVGA